MSNFDPWEVTKFTKFLLDKEPTIVNSVEHQEIKKIVKLTIAILVAELAYEGEAASKELAAAHGN